MRRQTDGPTFRQLRSLRISPNLQFASEVRQEVVRDIWKSFLSTLQAAGSIFGGLRRSASQSSHISEGRGAKSIVLNQGLYYIKRP